MNIAVVTGASSGMGRYFSLMIPLYFKDVEEIYIIARREQRLLKIKEKINIPVHIISKDLSSDLIFEELKNELSTHKCNIKVLVNCAGYGKSGSFEDIRNKDEFTQSNMSILNCSALTKMIEVCFPYFCKGTRIINVASAAAFCPQPGFAVYAATKSYVLSFSRALGYELKNKGIYITTVCPGPVDTEFFDVSGTVSSGFKKLFMADPKNVVKKALKDSVKKKELSIYGISMKFSYIASKILPHKLIMKLF